MFFAKTRTFPINVRTQVWCHMVRVLHSAQQYAMHSDWYLAKVALHHHDHMPSGLHDFAQSKTKNTTCTEKRDFLQTWN